MKRILLTGGTGYIGSHTAVELIKNGYEVGLLDNLSNSKKTVAGEIQKITGEKPKFFEADLMDFEKTLKVLTEFRPEAIMHFAGSKAVAESIREPLKYYENNVGGTLNLLKAMKKVGVKKLVFSSSATVYGGQDGKTEYNEKMTTGVKITSPYGWTKQMIEQIIRDYVVSEPGTTATILRYFNPIGADKSGLIGEDPNGIPNNLMPLVMKVYRGELKNLTIFGKDYETADGSCERDFIHVTDLAKGHVKALEKMAEGVKIYNLGTGKPTSVFTIIKTFEEVTGEKLPIKIGERRAGDLAVFYADPKLAEEELGWTAKLSVKDAIEDTLHYLRTH